MPYASWPYDDRTRNETNTLRGRFGLTHGHDCSSDPYRPAAQPPARQEAATVPEQYQSFTLSSIVRSARDDR